ncbi:hypothetical protein JAAARDRAFT_189614 [Jaapia argillacea MUCL 33604]|uniref:Uncharacterized protein n=1 Tax=Jaapia argillacea MUCL 33604 TaxID=933084 RepID=A0A067QI38_9AGAM|nr:hypothetical protein JAAARDRAFT_189614 [Jaapia argillacea MUCL 33604]
MFTTSTVLAASPLRVVMADEEELKVVRRVLYASEYDYGSDTNSISTPSTSVLSLDLVSELSYLQEEEVGDGDITDNFDLFSEKVNETAWVSIDEVSFADACSQLGLEEFVDVAISSDDDLPLPLAHPDSDSFPPPPRSRPDSQLLPSLVSFLPKQRESVRSPARHIKRRSVVVREPLSGDNLRLFLSKPTEYRCPNPQCDKCKILAEDRKRPLAVEVDERRERLKGLNKVKAWFRK